MVYGKEKRALLNSVKGINMEQRDPRTTICKVYFKQILAFNAETWTFIKKNESKIQTVNMKYLRSIKRKTKRDRIKN
jgi:hypothetical protein